MVVSPDESMGPLGDELYLYQNSNGELSGYRAFGGAVVTVAATTDSVLRIIGGGGSFDQIIAYDATSGMWNI
jgi:hypothetical protein